MAARSTPQDLLERYDYRVVGELSVDDDTSPTEQAVLQSSTVAKALLRAAGDVDVALRAGGLYTPDQLASELDANSVEHLKDIECAVAMAKLFQRRPGVHEEMAEQIRKTAREDLKELRTGVNVFGLSTTDEHIDAGRAHTDGGPSVETINNRNFLASRLSGHHIPDFRQSQPRDRL